MDIIDRKSAEAWYEAMTSLRALTRPKLVSKIGELKTRLMFTDLMNLIAIHGLKSAIGYLIEIRDRDEKLGPRW